MPAAISLDLRKRIAAAIVSQEESHPLIADRFAVSVATVERISRRVREAESLEPSKSTGRKPVLDDTHFAWLVAELERDPYANSYALTHSFNKRFQKNKVHRSTILRAMHQLGYSFKKNSILPTT